MSGSGGGRAPEGRGYRLPAASARWDGQGALQAALEKHVLDPEAHPTEGAAFNAAMGDLILSYLDSLPTKTRLEVLLALKGPAGFPEERLLSDAAEGETKGEARERLWGAARALQAEGKLRRVKTPDGQIFWIPWGPLLDEGARD